MGTKSITELIREVPKGTDYQFVGPTHECPCGTDLFIVLATFEDGEISTYFTDALCALCGSDLRLPTLELVEVMERDSLND